MPTPGERRALIFIAGIAALGVTVRGCREVKGPGIGTVVTGERSALARQIEAVDSAIAVGGEKRRGRGGKRDATVSKSRATSGSRAVSPTGEPVPTGAMPPEWPPTSRYPKAWVTPTPSLSQSAQARRSSRVRLDSMRAPGYARERVAPSHTRRGASSHALRPPVDLDTAGPEEIASLALIGPALARRIVAERIERGPFGSIAGLERVRGVSRPLARRLQPYVTFSLAPRLESVPEATVPARRRRSP